MKKLQIILRLETVDQVMDALTAIGIGGATAMEVRGFGRQRGHTEIYRSQTTEVDFRSKIMLEMVMEDEKVDQAVQDIMNHARTGPCRRRKDIHPARGRSHPHPHGRIRSRSPLKTKKGSGAFPRFLNGTDSHLESALAACGIPEFRKFETSTHR